jgi:hypothetical protein
LVVGIFVCRLGGNRRFILPILTKGYLSELCNSLILKRVQTGRELLTISKVSSGGSMNDS